MEIFYANEINGGLALLDADESAHCVRVLRHRVGDEVTVVDGIGNMYRCRLSDDSPKGAAAEILETVPGWGGHSYSLNMAVCPTKNNDRFEWFVEKATERSRKIALSAMKQSLKAKLPLVEEPVSVRDFILGHSGDSGVKMICYCFEGETLRRSIKDVLEGLPSDSAVTVLIGPEGDFSPEEARLAVGHGFVPVHLGPSRLRTETAAVTAVTACYLHFME